MSLLQLNNDALLAVFPFCPDQTLSRLSQTCSRLSDLIKPTLKHRELLPRWSTIRLAYSPSHSADFDHPIEIIAKFRENPYTADYVKTIEFAAPHPRAWQEFHPDDQPSQEVKDLVKSCNYLDDYIDDFTFLTDEQKASWKKGVREFDANPCFVVLLSLCKRTKNLLLTDPYELFEDYFNTVIDYMKTEDRKEPGKCIETGMLGFFPAVTRLDLIHWDTEGGLQFQNCWPFLGIPSLKVLEGNMLGNEYEPEEMNWPTTLADSKIEKITLVETLLRPADMVEWIRQQPCLKEFYNYGRYDFDGDNIDEGWGGGIHGYVESLKDHGKALFEERSYSAKVEKWMEPPGAWEHEAIVVRKLEN